LDAPQPWTPGAVAPFNPSLHAPGTPVSLPALKARAQPTVPQLALLTIFPEKSYCLLVVKYALRSNLFEVVKQLKVFHNF